MICTYNQDYDDLSIKNKIVFDFKSDQYFKIDKMIFKDEKSAEIYYNEILDYVDEYNLRLIGNIIISEEKEGIPSNKTKKELKEQYKSYDYKCR